MISTSLATHRERGRGSALCVFIRCYLILLLNDFVWLWLLVSDIYALEAVYVLGEAGLGDVGLPGLYGLHQSVVDKDVLLLSLYEAVPLTSEKKIAVS